MLTRTREILYGCIGCGCLSLKKCQLYNPQDRAGRADRGRVMCWVTGLWRRPIDQNMYFIFTVCLPAPASTNAAALKLGGPNMILGLREKPKPSLGIAIEVSSLPLAFSSWIKDKA